VYHADSAMRVPNALHEHVVEYFEGGCWDQAEMEVNQLTRSERRRLEFPDLVEIFYMAFASNTRSGACFRLLPGTLLI
jgi:hypothetical protein